MRIYTKEDINPMSWEEYGTVIDTLLNKIDQSGLSFDAIAPIMRSGAIPGNALAISLRIFQMIPLQFKYLHNPPRLEQMISIPALFRGRTDIRSILVCENNTSTGKTAEAAIKHLKEYFPKSKLCYATVAKVFGGPNSLEGPEECFFGVQTNERFLASPAQIKAFSLRLGITLFPWEVLEDELTEMDNCD